MNTKKASKDHYIVVLVWSVILVVWDSYPLFQTHYPEIVIGKIIGNVFACVLIPIILLKFNMIKTSFVFLAFFSFGIITSSPL